MSTSTTRSSSHRRYRIRRLLVLGLLGLVGGLVSCGSCGEDTRLTDAGDWVSVDTEGDRPADVDGRAADTVDATDLNPDSRETTDSGVDTDAADSDAGTSWAESFEDRCPPDDLAGVEAEQYRSGELPDSVGETPRVVWKEPVECRVTDEEDPRDTIVRPDADSTHADYLAYGEMRHDEGRKRLVATVHHAKTYQTLSYTANAAALVDPETGRTVSCDQFERHTPRGRRTFPYIVGGELAVVSELGAYVGIYDTVAGEMPENRPQKTGWFSGDAVGENFEHQNVSSRSYDGQQPPILAVSRDGLLVFTYREDYLVGADLRSGKVYWVKEIDEVNPEYLKRDLFSLETLPGLEGVIAYTDGADRTMRAFRIDRCGKAERLFDEYREPTSVKKVGDNHLVGERKEHRIDQRGHYLYAADGSMIRELECPTSLVTVDTETIACVETGRKESHGPRIRVERLRPEGTSRVIPLPDASEPDDWEDVERWMHTWLVAGADRTIIAGDYYNLESGETSKTLHRVHVIPVEQPKSRRTLEFTTPGDAGNGGYPPVLTRSGVLVYEVGVELYGIQTSVPGLTRAPYPRMKAGVESGSEITGGNENRDYVEVPASSETDN